MIPSPHRTRRSAVLAAFAALLLFGPSADAKQFSVSQIVNNTNEASYYQGKDGRATVSMTIVDSNGRKRTRELTILRRNDGKVGGDQKFYAYFHKPADVAKMVFIVHKHIGRDDDRWLYLPALDLVKRIAATDKRTSFVGSDFYYEDVSGRQLDEDTHELEKTTNNYYVLKHTPKKAGSVEFSYYRMHIHKKTFLPTKVEYFDKKGAKYRVMTVVSTATIQGHPTVTKATMESLDSGTKTVVEYSNVSYDLGLPDKVFGERYLRRAPLKYLRSK